MKKTLGFLVVFALLLNSCGKTDTGCKPVAVSSEKAQLIAYCNANGINYTEHTTGLFYQIMDPGMGASPTISSKISVVYSGKHFDNTVFDFSNTPSEYFALSNLVDGWKIGLPLIKKGGRIKLVIPSALAYSCAGSKRNDVYVIQPNEPIFFDLTLADIR